MKGGAHKRRGIEGVQDDTVGVIASMKGGTHERRSDARGQVDRPAIASMKGTPASAATGVSEPGPCISSGLDEGRRPRAPRHLFPAESTTANILPR